MQKKIVFLSFLFFWYTYTFGQKSLLLRNKKSGKIITYKVNSRVSYMESQEQEYTSGKLNDLLDSSVVFGKDTIALKNILIIRNKNLFHKIARIAGIPLMFIGTLLMGGGIAEIYSGAGEGSKSLLLGIGVFAAGYFPYGISYKDLTVDSKGEWYLEIYNGKP